jgi:hypothetical protein
MRLTGQGICSASCIFLVILPASASGKMLEPAFYFEILWRPVEKLLIFLYGDPMTESGKT